MSYSIDYINWTIPAKANELWKACLERDILPDGQSSSIADGHNLQAQYFNILQSAIESNVGQFVDETDSSLPDLTLASFRTKAGLNASGFRRMTTESGAFTYGQIQPSDYIGQWLIDDIISALDALQYRSTGVIGGDITAWGTSNCQFGESCATSYAAAIANWSETPHYTFNHIYTSIAAANIVWAGMTPGYKWVGGRRWWKVAPSPRHTEVTGVSTVQYKLSAQALSVIFDFADIDSLGYAAVGTWKILLAESFGISDTIELDLGDLAPTETPLELTTLSCGDFEESEEEEFYEGIALGNTRIAYRIDYTYG